MISKRRDCAVAGRQPRKGRTEDSEKWFGTGACSGLDRRVAASAKFSRSSDAHACVANGAQISDGRFSRT